MNRTCITLDGASWASVSLQVKGVLYECCHRHAGKWRPERISLRLATGLLHDAAGRAQRGGQRGGQFVQLVAWLGQQGAQISVIGDGNLARHQLWLDPPIPHPWGSAARHGRTAGENHR
ncbi:MAG TPA: hypothetical protein VF798_03670 [Burkholderiaceae bacterium]